MPVRTHVRVCVSVRVRVHTCLHVYVHACACARVRACIHVCVLVYMRTCVHACVLLMCALSVREDSRLGCMLEGTATDALTGAAAAAGWLGPGEQLPSPLAILHMFNNYTVLTCYTGYPQIFRCHTRATQGTL